MHSRQRAVPPLSRVDSRGHHHHAWVSGTISKLPARCPHFHFRPPARPTRSLSPRAAAMARGVDTGVGSWVALVLLLLSSSVVLGLEWNKVRSGGKPRACNHCISRPCGKTGTKILGAAARTAPTSVDIGHTRAQKPCTRPRRHKDDSLRHQAGAMRQEYFEHVS